MSKLCRGGVLLMVALCTVACSATPGPAPVEDPIASVSPKPTTTPTQPRKQAQELAIGIDPVYTGFNPHVLADDSRFTQTLAGLVLPSTFIAGTINGDLLESVEVIDESGTVINTITPTDEENKEEAQPEQTPPAEAKTIRYQLAPEAQWSDGTPITVADFEYLWDSMLKTPGTVNPAGYRAIEDVKSASGGKVIEVTFAESFSQWRTLFNHLLPSHLLRGEKFSTVLAGGIPASAGKFTMRNFDRNRGVVTLNRNDRFWGKEPAQVEILSFREIRSSAQGLELISNGQISFMDITPTQTSTRAFELIPDTQVRVEADNYALEVVANAKLSKVLRQELRTVIDPKLIAQLAYGRDSEMSIPEHEHKPEPLHLSAMSEPLRIGVDPANPVAAAAATTMVHALAGMNVRATVVQADTNELMRSLIPAGDVDVVVALSNTNLADKYSCPVTDVLGANRSGYCDEETESLIKEYNAGQKTEEELEKVIAEVETEEALVTTLAYDVRLEVLGKGILGPDEDLAQWPDGLSSLEQWRIETK
ncbi:MAG: ABC transporter family substrate-binding protein [Corynebacterium sp.]|uniref:ABC transporter family substrate-binding protein n=1 Tax=Corynebacterium sp. TaxID=1720 RepID=UPI0026DD908B|nr:ABC transporter family substrate-binding protein [Corynebacterium sp.]MDO5097120.1 ABC transporter family substrate-binding protein [Corynebacterium sp.]